LVREGLSKLAKHFSSLKALGPKFVADFEEADDPDERERIIRDAFERTNALLSRLGLA
jgi:GTP1/Obg family GTP-binding protein